MSMLSHTNGTAVVPPEETAHHLTREEQVHYSDLERAERRRELARNRIKAAKQ